MGMIPDPRQIGDGDGDGPPIPGKSGIGDGDDPRLSAGAEQLHLMGSRMSPWTPSFKFSDCHHPRKKGPKKTQRHPASV
jgi:hypothetical protein